MFQYLFYPDDAELERQALAAAERTRLHLDELIAERSTRRGARDDVLERCLSMQAAGLPGMSALEIRNNLIGLIIGAIPTTSKCAALTLDFLLDRPELLAQAQAAARADDDTTLVQYVLESLRLNPFAPGITRICAEDYVVARGSLRATRIPKGTAVLAVTQSAMKDWRKVKKPAEFRLDRAAYLYLHFGAGLHSCFGKYINLAQIPRIVKSVLKREGLRRAPGPAGRIQSAGPFPTHLTLEWAS
jgi:cytochrome P450